MDVHVINFFDHLHPIDRFKSYDLLNEIYTRKARSFIQELKDPMKINTIIFMSALTATSFARVYDTNNNLLLERKSRTNVTNRFGLGGETQQRGDSENLTSNQGVPVLDNQNSLRSSSRGPTLLEDFLLREKIFQFDHERIPERIVHGRGSGAFGIFEATANISQLTKAAFLKKGTKTEVFVRFSTTNGGAGSVDTARDGRGFATKFYTSEGNYDLVGIGIPVFFIQDGIKFPDLIHSAKMEADRGYPQAASAHDTFWDFVSLLPETTHMLMWTMSDRGIPRSYRMMGGFGVHTFQLINELGESQLVRFHWKPRLGVQGLVWDEAVKIAGADNDYHRRDLFEAIKNKMFPEWDFGIQVFNHSWAEKQNYDVLDATKLIPEEEIPVQIIGRMQLNRNPENYLNEVEQAAFCPSHVVPGIDFTNDPLLHARLFSYLDTQHSRLGSTNFHQLPVNQAKKAKVNNYNRDGIMQKIVPKGRANYEPNSLYELNEPTGPRCPFTAFFTGKGITRPREIGDKMRLRGERFRDHYSQARMFWKSQTESEQAHVVNSFVFELSSVSLENVRTRTVSNLRNVDEGLAKRVADGLGIELPVKSKPASEPFNMPTSDALSVQKSMKHTIEGRSIGILIANGTNTNILHSLIQKVEDAKALPVLIGPTISNVSLSDGSKKSCDKQILGAPSVLFDAIALVLSEEGTKLLMKESAAVQFVKDAFSHLKAIGHTEGAEELMKKAGLQKNNGITGIGDEFIKAAGMRFWERESEVRMLH